MKTTTAAAWALALAAASLAMSGCADPQPAVGVGVSYQEGSTRGLLPAPRDQVVDAAAAVLDKLGFHQTTRAKGGPDIAIRGKNEAGRSVKVTVRFRGAGASELRVRMGVLGDQPLSNAIFKRIEQKLGVQTRIGRPHRGPGDRGPGRGP